MPADTYGRFYVHPSLDGQVFYDSKGTKRIYNDVVMVEICVLGSDKSSRSTPVFEKDGETPILAADGETFIDKYPRAWAAFNRQDGIELDGTPLSSLHGIGPSHAINLGAKGIETVEQLAGLSDGLVLGESGMVELRKKAQAYLAAMNPEIEAAEKAAKDAEIADLHRRIAEMEEAMQPKRGRPKKAVNE